MAAIIVEEIVNQIKHFCDPKRMPQVQAAVKLVVKQAAEVWRYARIERELISVSMPAAEDDDEPNDGWADVDQPGQNPTRVYRNRRTLLRLRPNIEREAVHEDFPEEPDMSQDREACLYLHGVALYIDSPSVLYRQRELAGIVNRSGSRAKLSTGNSGPSSPGNSRTEDRPVPTSRQAVPRAPPSPLLTASKNATPELVHGSRSTTHTNIPGTFPSGARGSREFGNRSSDQLERGSTRRSHSTRSSATASEDQAVRENSESAGRSEEIPHWGSSSP